MYEPFPENYVWNLSVNICLGMGGAMGEIDRANAEVRDVAKQGEDAGTEAFFTAWLKMADWVAALGDEAAGAGHGRSAAIKYCRATAYYIPPNGCRRAPTSRAKSPTGRCSTRWPPSDRKPR